MNYKATLLSAGVFPGLGQLIWGRNGKEKFKGIIFIFLTVLPLMGLFYFLFQDIVQAMPPPQQTPTDLEGIMKLSWKIKEEIFLKQSKHFAIASAIILPAWLINIWDAYRLDKKLKY